MEGVIQEYYENNAKKLYGMVDKILFCKGYGGIHDKDGLYAIATDVFVSSVKNHDEDKGNFYNFLYSNLSRKIITSIRDSNRAKRSNTKQVIDEDGSVRYEFMPDISIDAPIGDGNSTIGDIVEDKAQTDLSINTELYLESLSETQKKIANMTMENYSPLEIREKLNMSEEKYTKVFSDMKSLEKRIILKHDVCKVEEDISLSKNNTQTFEKSKTDRLSISSIIKKISNRTIRFDHPLQRPSDQWTSAMQGNLISDILQGNPIPSLTLAEQIVNGFQVIWDLDGKQRCTTAYSYSDNGFKISKKIRRWNISYQIRLKDEENNEIIDENGVPKIEMKNFDIRDKKFSQLPEELQDKFLDYNFEIVQYINCSSEDIAYHIARYNEGKPMSISHKGIIRLGEDFARMVKTISVMPFFKELGGYTVSEAKGTNGILNRVVVESVMAANYLNDWKKNQEDMCDYMKTYATSEVFENFEDIVDRLSKVGTEEMFEQFNSKDSFLYFGLFTRFENTGLEDDKFVEFMIEFAQSLHSKAIKGVTYDSLCVNEEGKSASNKDKTVAVDKINLLEELMLDYFSISAEVICPEEICVLDFVQENIGQDIGQEDIEFYESMLEDLSLNIDNNTKLLEDKNKPSLLAIMAYSCQKDIDLDNWFIDFFNKNDNYIHNQKENYIKMRDDLEKYMEQIEKNKVSATIVINGGKLACAI